MLYKYPWVVFHICSSLAGSIVLQAYKQCPQVVGIASAYVKKATCLK